MPPKYNLDKIKFTTDRSTFEKAVNIYEADGVKNFKHDGLGFVSKVRGSRGNFYQVYISAQSFDRGNCDCYLGQNDTLCKHHVALAMYALLGGRKLTEEEKRFIDSPRFSGKLAELSQAEIKEIKAEISAAMRYIKPYQGPSRTWFSYQNSLAEGCRRLSKIVSQLPVSERTTKVLVELLLRLDEKLCRSGVDDSDGTVGAFIVDTVQVLREYVGLNPNCARSFEQLVGRETCFDWEEPLLEYINN